MLSLLKRLCKSCSAVPLSRTHYRAGPRLGVEELGGRFRAASSRHSRTVRPAVEVLEQRQVPSASGQISAVADYFGQPAVATLNQNHIVALNSQSLGVYALSVSMGLDPAGRAELFIIAIDHSLWLRDGVGWHNFGGYITDLSATENNAVYAMAADHTPWVHNASGWHNLGGYVFAISAGLDANGRDEMFAIGRDHAAWANDAGGWHSFGGYVTQISGTSHNELFALAADHTPWVHNAATGWHNLGGYVISISAGTDRFGRDALYCIGDDHVVWERTSAGWYNLGDLFNGNSTVQIAGARDYVFTMTAGHETTPWAHRSADSAGAGWYPFA